MKELELLKTALLRNNVPTITFILLKVYSRFWFIHRVVQQSPVSDSRAFPSPQRETPYLLAVAPHLCFPLHSP